MDTKKCDECSSLFYGDKSEMAGLCPECAHHLYGYTNCEHDFNGDRCSKCHWDGSMSAFVKKIKEEESSA